MSEMDPFEFGSKTGHEKLLEHIGKMPYYNEDIERLHRKLREPFDWRLHRRWLAMLGRWMRTGGFPLRLLGAVLLLATLGVVTGGTLLAIVLAGVVAVKLWVVAPWLIPALGFFALCTAMAWTRWE